MVAINMQLSWYCSKGGGREGGERTEYSRKRDHYKTHDLLLVVYTVFEFITHSRNIFIYLLNSKVHVSGIDQASKNINN